MPEDRLPQRVLYGQLRLGHRSAGGQKKHFKDQLKISLRKCGLDPGSLETMASDQTTWRPTGSGDSVNTPQAGYFGLFHYCIGNAADF
ncbi:hypothetical protein SKAU_G00170360 [Synaphobranchus kaupii]|uniref:Uncharacterized protein n=1 Tax=Synaphobranchus kaupii TaxID=118154 RepID=A0A9Q1IZQ9_SYNKA|nr:hypothetical protein SKAU_G00170360 [Synaphobranchus kaupii]